MPKTTRDLSPGAARELIESIRTDLVSLAEKITRAWDGCAWLALGYVDWRELCQHEFGGGLQLPPGQRRQVAADLAGAGMSTRAIGQVLDTPQRTIADDVSGNRSPEISVKGLDGKTYTRPRMIRPAVDVLPPVEPAPTEWSDAVQTVSATCPMHDLTSDEIRWLHSAATFLRDYCQGALTIRGDKL